VILNGPKLLLRPLKAWTGAVGSSPRRASWLIAAALTAAVWPGVAVVMGHVGSAALGETDVRTATLRAAIGFLSVVGGALVMAPALTLILHWLTGIAREETTPEETGPVAMGIIWPTWCAGLVLVFPPLLGLGPEFGELVWAALAVALAVQALRRSAVPSLAIRRRWATRFVVHGALAFTLTFAAVSLAPAFGVRSLMGASTTLEPNLPDGPVLPRPPEPDW
jgi:hypothetical protein